MVNVERCDGGPGALRRYSCKLVARCRRRLLIYGWWLDGRIYDQACFVSGVRQLVVRHSRAQVAILVADAQALARRGGPLLALARRLPSQIALRQRSPEDAEAPDSFLVVDDQAFIHRPSWSNHSHFVVSDSRSARARQLARRFAAAWEEADTPAVLRELHL